MYGSSALCCDTFDNYAPVVSAIMAQQLQPAPDQQFSLMDSFCNFALDYVQGELCEIAGATGAQEGLSVYNSRVRVISLFLTRTVHVSH